MVSVIGVFRPVVELDLAPRQIAVLALFDASSTFTYGEVCDASGIPSRAAVCRAVAALVDGGLVSVGAFAGDARRITVTLTKKGRDTLKALRKAIAAAVPAEKRAA